MSSRLPSRGYRKYDPSRLGHSLPVARGMARGRWVALAAGLLVLAAVARIWQAQLAPRVEARVPLEHQPAELLRAVPDKVSDDRRGLPVWDPGPPLSEVDAPDFLLVRDAGFSGATLPGDGDNLGEMITLAQDYLAQGDPTAARAVLQRLLRSYPESWTLRYNLGMVALRSGHPVRAQEHFTEARGLADQRQGRYDDSARFFAAKVATRYSLGLARLRDPSSCEEGIVELKRAIGDTKSYLETADILAADENDLFRIEGFELDSYQIRNALIEGYLMCGRYPEAYFARRSWAQSFQESEYGKADDPQLLAGPFADELAECVVQTTPSGRCWALSNLNQVYLSSKAYLPDADGSSRLPPRLAPAAGSLVRMMYNIAVLVAQRSESTDDSEASRQANGFLETAYLIHQRYPDPELRQRIEQFGRHLAAASQNYALLGLPYRDVATDRLSWGPESTPEDMKGVAWALRERCHDALRQGRPAAVFPLIDGVRSRLPSPGDVSSLDAWSEQVRRNLQNAILDRMSVAIEEGETSEALGLRLLEEPYLGDDWSRRAWRRWLTAGRLLVLLSSLMVGIGLWWLGRLLLQKVLLPYLLYNSRFYESEFRYRHQELKAQHIPFTAQELAERRVSRRSDSP